MWREVVWEAFVPVSLARNAEGPFPSRVSARTVGPIAVSEIFSQEQSVTRAAEHVSRQAGDVFFLNLPLSDGASARQNGHSADLKPGDFVLVDSTRPFELCFGRPFRQISLTLPHDALAPLLASPSGATGVRIPGDQGVGAIAASAIRALAQNGADFDRHAAQAVTTHIAGLVALAVGGLVAPPRSATRAMLLQAALDEVERSLGDPNLSPAGVAESLRISTRYLHNLFADRGESFGQWVLRRRLERSRLDLEDPAKAHWSVAQIAYHHGFQDPSYFARAFRLRFGASPKEFRRRAGGG